MAFAQRTKRIVNEIDDFINSEQNFMLGDITAVQSDSVILVRKRKKCSKCIYIRTPFVGTRQFQKYYKSDLWKLPELCNTTRSSGEKNTIHLQASRQMNNLFFEDDDIWKHHDLETYSNLLRH